MAYNTTMSIFRRKQNYLILLYISFFLFPISSLHEYRGKQNKKKIAPFQKVEKKYFYQQANNLSNSAAFFVCPFGHLPKKRKCIFQLKFFTNAFLVGKFTQTIGQTCHFSSIPIYMYTRARVLCELKESVQMRII